MAAPASGIGGTDKRRGVGVYRGRKPGEGASRRRAGPNAPRYLGIDECVVCGFEGRGFGFQLDLSALYPHYEFCSRKCQNVGALIASKHMGRIDNTVALSDIEQRAIVDARTQFAEAVERQGLMPAFFNCTPEQIDDIIKAVVTGFQASVQRAMGRGEVPF